MYRMHMYSYILKTICSSSVTLGFCLFSNTGFFFLQKSLSDAGSIVFESVIGRADSESDHAQIGCGDTFARGDGDWMQSRGSWCYNLF